MVRKGGKHAHWLDQLTAHRTTHLPLEKRDGRDLAQPIHLAFNHAASSAGLIRKEPKVLLRPTNKASSSDSTFH